jgi:ABC-type multidrug transport system fused ATPase/permease subunit
MSEKVKLQIVDTLGEALSFAWKKLPVIIFVTLIPTVILIGPVFYFVLTQFGDLFSELSTLAQSAEGEVDDAQLETIALTILPIYAIFLLMLPLHLLYYAMISVPLNRYIVLSERPGPIRLDRYVWRYFFGQIVFWFLSVGIILGIMGPVVAAIIALKDYGDGGEFATVAIGFFGVGLVIFLLVRLSLFMVEVSINGKFNVRNAFKMTRGNFWRLVGVFLLFIVLFMALSFVFEIVFYGFGALALFSNIGAIEAATETEDIGAIFAALRDMVLSPIGGIFAGIFALYLLFITGLQVAMPAFVYKALYRID